MALPFGGNTMVRWSLTSSANYSTWVQGILKLPQHLSHMAIYKAANLTARQSLYTTPS